jgi:DNA-binding response OmpR family regulator
MNSETSQAENGEPARILIIEDEALVALEMESILSDAGYEVVGVADDQSSAMAAVDRSTPDLALVDIQLANRSSGFHVAAELSKRGVCCLFVTGNCPAERGQGHAVGCLHKPFNERILLGAVAAAEKLMRGARPERLPRGMHLYQ